MKPAAPSRRGRFGRGDARAVTLIEILVAAAILAAILALAAPLALRALQRRAFDAAQMELLAAVDSARAHAQREGVVVELAVDEAGRRLRASAWPLDGGEPAAIPSLRTDLPAPMRLVVGGTTGEDGANGAGGSAAAAGADRGGGPRRVDDAGADADHGGGLIALFLPDGSAPVSVPCVLRGNESDEEVTITISGPLGRARVERRRAAPAVDDAPAETAEARP